MNWLIETKNRGRISVDLEKCCACRSCELACSFHHQRKFDPSRSSIKVRREDGEGTLEISVISTCDGCPGDKPPWCVRFCSSGCLQLEEG
jgi:anaerobic carbon-monoxide dehydrogenase iron sulfur subunit